ncbi:murein biosynthesis integral membrane protein MurJ [Limibacillus halophilus]|uniref:Probable lipid II flippase MurJ n=1 Tax=Limibacillus halophilus TaxID=1579333 RepID=A0A839SUU0_9PROT|nr:murein biosynthesis integral membrane protein MurJ [Limibacillus halophilus]MBB3066561.1 putative peptidoglycan lipid II flippase [Limibacillus halophilus]
MALVRSLATVGGWTAASRFLGFLRDVLLAGVLGDGPVADAFFVAFKLPNFFRRLFAEGAFNAAFVPLFSRRLEQEGESSAKAFAEDSLAALLVLLLAVTVPALIFMPGLVTVIAPGFLDDADKFEQTVTLSRITFFYLLFMSLAALIGGILNSLYRFTAAAAAPVLLNLCFLVTLTGVLPFLSPEQTGPALAYTVTLAGLAQFLMVYVVAAKHGMALRLPRPRFTPGVKRLFSLMGPGILSGGAVQINIMVGTIVASLQAGAVSWLYYADRVYQLPLGLIGVALGVVLLPELSRKLRAGNRDAALHSFNRGLEMALLLTLPATIALLIVPLPIVVALFERGAFDRQASDAAAAALAAYASGLPAFILVKPFQAAFFAQEDTVTPLKMASVSVIANIVLCVGLFFWLGHVGIALATSLAAWLHVALLILSLKGRDFFHLDLRLKQRLPRMTVASLVMGALLYGLSIPLLPWLDDGIALQAASLAILVACGMISYFGLALAAGAFSARDFKVLFRRNP